MTRATILELPARFADSARALRQVDTLLRAGPPTELVVLPEASLTGYVSPRGDFDLTRFAEPLDGATATALAAMARAHRCHLVAPLIERDGGGLFNSVIGLAPDGTRWLHYRKRHPWYPETWATPGELPWPEVNVLGLRVTAAVCFDVHFLAEEAAGPLERADLLLFPSAWVDEAEGSDARPGHLVPLAQRFGVAVLNANWGAGRPAVLGQGGSLAIDSSGRIVSRLEGGLRLDVELEALVRAVR